MEHLVLNINDARTRGIVPALLLEMPELLRGRRFSSSILKSVQRFNAQPAHGMKIQYAWQWMIRHPWYRHKELIRFGRARSHVIDEAFEDVSGLPIHDVHVRLDPDFYEFLKTASADDRSPLVNPGIDRTSAREELEVTTTSLDLTLAQIKHSGETPPLMMKVARFKTKIALLKAIIAAN